MANKKSHMLREIESWGEDHIRGKYVTLLFETEYNGIWRCTWEKNGLKEWDQEPSFHFLLADEQKAIKQIGPIVFYFTHGVEPEDLSGYES